MEDNAPIVIPSYLDEKLVLLMIEKVLSKVAKTFTFAYWDTDDIKQEARILAIRELHKYNPDRIKDKTDGTKLYNFLYSVIVTRLINFKRDNFKRNDAPCLDCHEAMIEGSKPKHEYEEFCEKYKQWYNRNQNKQNLQEPGELKGDELDTSTFCDEVELHDIVRRIDEELPMELRETYLKMKSGKYVPRVLQEQIKRKISEILGDSVCLPD